MAGGDSGLGNRTITEDQNEEESASYALMYKHFKENKVEIASAITKPYPFFMSLRDHGFISEEMFQDFQESFRDLVPLHRVIYRALEELEKNFNMTVLQKLFCKVNMENYPDLKFIRRSFKNVFPNALCSQGSARGDLNSELSLKQEAMDTRNNITVGESRKRRGGNRSGGQAATRRKKREKTPESSVQNRVLRRRRNETADFSAELLPVTCGNLKGMLHKDKFKQGTSVMSIQCEDGNWFTPQEFEIMGGHERAKNWKLSLRCYNWPLKFLIKRNFLPNPPQKYARKKKQGTQNLYHSQADPCVSTNSWLQSLKNPAVLSP
nr:nuclear body protein SP140-like [Meriones unguiculatus]